MSAFIRLGLLGLAAAACLASGSSSDRSPPPQGPPPQQGQPPPGQGGPGWWCHNEQANTGRIASQCRPAMDACESERASAEAAGLAVSTCAQVPQVACFQLAAASAPPPGGPAGAGPGAAGAAGEWCAASLEDCEFWKGIDVQKNGSSGQRCAWKR